MGRRFAPTFGSNWAAISTPLIQIKPGANDERKLTTSA